MEIFPGENPTKSNVIVSFKRLVIKKKKKKERKIKKKGETQRHFEWPLKKKKEKNRRSSETAEWPDPLLSDTMRW